MSVDFESLSGVLKNLTRRKIILCLSRNSPVSYVDLMSLTNVTNTGKFNYHLKILGDLIQKNQDGKYCLSDKGQLAAQFLEKFSEKKTEPVPLRMADAVLIGFAGAVLTALNPGFWTSAAVAISGIAVALPFFVVFGAAGFFFGLVVPGAVMWILSVRRSHSHDPYDMFKPPFVAFVMLMLVVVIMVLLKTNVTLTIITPVETGVSQDTGSTVSSYSIMQTSLLTYLVLGVVLSFPGVLVAEFASRVRKRMMF